MLGLALAIAPSPVPAQGAETPKVLDIYLEADNPSERYATLGDTVTVTVFTDLADTVTAATATVPSTDLAPRLTVTIGGTLVELTKTAPANVSASRTTVFEFTVTETTPEGPVNASYRDFDELTALSEVTVDRTAPAVAVTLATSHRNGRSVTVGDTITVTATAAEEIFPIAVVVAESAVSLTRLPTHAGSLFSNALDGNSGAALGEPTSVFVQGNYAYVTSWASDALEIVNVSNPAMPSLAGAIFHDDLEDLTDGNSKAALDGARSVFVLRDHAYIAAEESNALEIVNVSNPAMPTHAGVIRHGQDGAALDEPYSVFVRGRYAYVASRRSSALEIVDVSDPTGPVHAGVLRHSPGGATLQSPHSLFARGDYVYLAAHLSHALEIADVSNPASPSHGGSLSYGNTSGNSGAALKQPLAVFALDRYAYLTSLGANALAVVDIANPAAPALVGTLFRDNPDDDTDGNSGAALHNPNSLFVRGDYAYVASVQSDSLEIVAVSDPANPTLAGAIFHDDMEDNTDGNSGATLDGAHSVFVAGDYAYVASAAANALEIVALGNGLQGRLTATAAHATGDVTALPRRLAFRDLAGNVSTAGNFPPRVATPLPNTSFTVNQGEAFHYAIPAGTFEDLNGADTLRYGFTSIPDISSWLSLDSNSRVFRGRPGNGDVTAAPVAITLTATDPEGGTAAVEFQLSVLNINDRPTAAADILPAAVTGGPAVTVNVLANDTDMDAGQTPTVTAYSAGRSLAASPTAAPMDLTGGFGTLRIAVDGTATFTPGATVGTYSFAYRVTDGSGTGNDNATATLMVDVLPTNAAPAARPDSLTVLTGAPSARVNVLTNDSDADAGQTLVVANYARGGAQSSRCHCAADALAMTGFPTAALANSSPAAAGVALAGELGTLNIAADGTVTYTADTVVGTDTFTYQVSDGSGAVNGRAIARLTVTVAADPLIGSRPVVAGTVATQVTAVGQDFSLDLSDLATTDPDGVDSRVILGVAQDDGATLPDWLAFDADSRILGGRPGTAADVAELDLAITPTDSAGTTGWPLAFPLLVRETALALTGEFVLYADEVRVRVTQAPGSLAPSAALKYALAVSSPDLAIAVVADDGTAGSTAATRALSREIAADSPPGSVHEVLLTFDRELSPGAGQDSNNITVILGYPATAGKAFAVAGSAMLALSVPTREPSGIPAVSKALDDRILTVTRHWEFVVPEDTFVEPDREALSYQATLADGSPLPDWLSFAPETRTFSGTPPSAAISLSHVIKVVASDPHDYGATDTFRLDFRAVPDNSAPNLVTANTPAPQLPAEDAAFMLDVSGAFADADDGDSLTFHAAVLTDAEMPLPSALELLERGAAYALPDWLDFDSATGIFRGMPDQAAVDADVFTVVVTANDGRGGEATLSFTIDPANVNDVPTLARPIPNRRIVAGRRFTLGISAHFADEDTEDSLVLSAAPAGSEDGMLPAWLSFDAATGTFSGTPRAADVSATPILITVTASDGSADGMVSTSFAIAVATTENRPPVAAILADRQVRANAPFTLNLAGEAFTDPDGDSLILSAAPAGDEDGMLPAWLAFDSMTGTFSGTPPAAAAGTVIKITMTADDGYGGSETTDFALRVGAPNLAPETRAAIPALTAYAGIPFSYPVPGNAFGDGDGDQLSFSAARADGGTLPTWLSFDREARAFAGTPKEEDIAAAAVRVAITATDGRGGSAESEFAVTVAAPPAGGAVSEVGDRWILTLPYVSMDFTAPPGSLACAALRLSAPLNQLLNWSLEVTDPAPLGCRVPSGSSALPTVRGPFPYLLSVPAAESMMTAEPTCLAMEFSLGTAAELRSAALVDCR